MSKDKKESEEFGAGAGVAGSALRESFSQTSRKASELQTLKSILVLSSSAWREVSWESVICVHTWQF